jgi:hypothetical protein
MPLAEDQPGAAEVKMFMPIGSESTITTTTKSTINSSNKNRSHTGAVDFGAVHCSKFAPQTIGGIHCHWHWPFG